MHLEHHLDLKLSQNPIVFALVTWWEIGQSPSVEQVPATEKSPLTLRIAPPRTALAGCHFHELEGFGLAAVGRLLIELLPCFVDLAYRFGRRGAGWATTELL